MGNLSKKAKAKVDVTLENSILLQGEVVKGLISIKPKNGSDITKLSNPKINFAILQEQSWQSFLFSQEDKTTKNGMSNNSFYSNQTMNCSQYKDKNISEGITIPFQYNIPYDITPSLEWPSTRYEFAYIRNFLNVTIDELAFTKKILLIILKRPCLLQSPLRMSVVEERKKFLLFGSGKIVVEGSYPKSSFPILGTIPLTVKVDASKSDVLIKNVVVKLKRKLDFYSKDRLKSIRSILQNMYEEKKSVSSKSEDILFNIPFKDGTDIKYNMKSSALGENTEICCLIPNVQTSTIKVAYYIKITAEPDDLLAKKIELKMMVDFYSKDQDQLNTTVYDNFNNQIAKINSGQVDINYMEPYLNNQNNYNFNPRMSVNVYSHCNSLNLQSNNNNFNDLNRINSLNQNNFNQNQNQFNNNNYDNAAPPRFPGYQDNNNNIYQNNYPNNSNYQNMNDNLNINNINNEQNSMNLPQPHNQNLEEEQADLPTLEEIEQQKEFNKPQVQEYPSF
jgi:hypothetical protein